MIQKVLYRRNKKLAISAVVHNLKKTCKVHKPALGQHCNYGPKTILSEESRAQQRRPYLNENNIYFVSLPQKIKQTNYLDKC